MMEVDCEFVAGAADVDITPEENVFLCGYPAETVNIRRTRLGGGTVAIADHLSLWVPPGHPGLRQFLSVFWSVSSGRHRNGAPAQPEIVSRSRVPSIRRGWRDGKCRSPDAQATRRNIRRILPPQPPKASAVVRSKSFSVWQIVAEPPLPCFCFAWKRLHPLTQKL